MKINWAQKLSSRKFWAALAGFITALLFAFGVKQPTVEQVAALIAALSTLVVYIVSEGHVDASRNKQAINYNVDVVEECVEGLKQ